MQEKPTSRHFNFIAMIKWSKIRCPAQDHVNENNRVDERVRNMGVECSKKKRARTGTVLSVKTGFFFF
jgi:hypothetical protein